MGVARAQGAEDGMRSMSPQGSANPESTVTDLPPVPLICT